MFSSAFHSIEELYDPPRLAWSERRALWRYYVRDTGIGIAQHVIPHALLRLLPTDAASAIGARLGPRTGRRWVEATARARAVFRHLRPEAGEAELDAMMQAHWRNLGRSMAEFSALERLWGEGRVTVEGLHHVTDAFAAGRSVLIAGTHVGYWEMLPIALSMLRIPSQGIYMRLANRFRMRVANAARTRAYAQGMPLRRHRPTSAALVAARRALSRPGTAFLYYVDEYWQGRVHAPLLGRPPQPIGNIAKAVRLAMATGAAVVPAAALRDGDAARFRMVFLPPVPMAAAPDAAAQDATAMANQLALDAAIEAVLRQAPEQWLCAHAFRFDR
ncbi:lysophospholipid acyltransferase family protein [Falsiroseomonas ponticola]|uniref:lysophospholipid acyltransferase family protein n=1 Tax=Falsiroseomonas ponticola TaxID=2786951 RepID=UPI0019334AC7|nr:hypothetical protein [Roseomonas ponticola]